MQVIINLTILSFILVFIIDKSGVIDSIKHFIGKYLGIKDVQLKPFECSLCMTFWTDLIYLAFFSTFNLYYFLYTCFLAFSTPLIGYAYDVIYNFIEKILLNLDESVKNI